MAHAAEVPIQANLKTALGIVGPDGLRLEVMGPPAELEKLKPIFAPLKADFYELDKDSMAFFNTSASGRNIGNDNHVTILPYFTVPDGKIEEFRKHFSKFYEKTRQGTGKQGQCLYYGFAIDAENNTVFCREGYKNAQAVLAHLDEVKETLNEALELVGSKNLQVSVMGPKAELVKLKETFKPLNARFFELDENALLLLQ